MSRCGGAPWRLCPLAAHRGGGAEGAQDPRTVPSAHPEPGVPTCDKTPSSLTVKQPGRVGFRKGATQPEPRAL